MNTPPRNFANHTPEMLSLNLDDLNAEELERRIELAAAFSPGALSNCGQNTCPHLQSCDKNG